MIDHIESLLEAKNYHQALELIEQNLDTVVSTGDESIYFKLFELRVIAKHYLQETDAIIRDHVRREKFPSAAYHTIETSHKIKLIYKSAFLEQSDAYINTVSADNPFDIVSERSATVEFIKCLGREEIEQQIKTQLSKSRGDFIKLAHKNMSAPMSYHILFYHKNSVEYETLEIGIKKVLDDVSKNRLKTISFFPLGFDIVLQVDQNQKHQLAHQIADKTAEIIVGYIIENKQRHIPTIVFNFVSTLTMQTYQKAFSKWADIKKPYFSVMKQVTEKQKKIVKEALTRNSKYIEKLKELAFTVDDRSSILLLGETGVGKSFLSKIIHKNSIRSGNPFIEKNCQQITRELIYVQLFGAVKGSFTGASQDIKGAIDKAKGGILFLDEIANADLEVQRSLLKFLDEGKYFRLGKEGVEEKADIKLIFGTNVELEKEITANTFSHDLFERISHNSLTIPPLRARREDIPLLVEYFKNDINQNSQFKMELQRDAIELLTTYNWPGNVRQLLHYLGDIFRMTRSRNIPLVTPEVILEKPPRNELRQNNPESKLEVSLLEILNSWETKNGDILDSVVKPILSKVYSEDFKGKIKESNKYIGIDGTRGSKSALSRYIEKYQNKKNNIR